MQARSEWKTLVKGGQIGIEYELYFELQIGTVYENFGKYEDALKQYNKARLIKLPYNHPDEAFSYSCMGQVLYEMDEPVWAMRAYLKAR